MQEAADWELLRQYAHGNFHEAFAALLTRHANLVYSVALRKTGSPQAAEEITQAVFIILARKARELREKTVLSDWLYHTARLTAANFLRADMRRARREQDAYMQSLADETEPEVWPQIAPLLEEPLRGWEQEIATPLCSGSSKGRVFRKSPWRPGPVKTRPRSEFIMPWRNCAATLPNTAWFRPPQF